jgi:hypothetical protein
MTLLIGSRRYAKLFLHPAQTSHFAAATNGLTLPLERSTLLECSRNRDHLITQKPSAMYQLLLNRLNRGRADPHHLGVRAKAK